MALAISKIIENKSLTSYIKWLDASRPGTNQSFNNLSNFYKNHSHWPKTKIIKNIEASINGNTNPIKIVEWFQKSTYYIQRSYRPFRIINKTNKIENKQEMIKKFG